MNNRVCILIVYIGELPVWFSLWKYFALRNSNVSFIVIQDQLDESRESNIQYIRTTLEEINQLPLMRELHTKCYTPYKLCDYRPLFADLFGDLFEGFEYWGWGDIDVIYGDIDRTLKDAIGKYDYISTGWKGESGPLALLRNTEKVNSLWRKIPNIEDILRDKESYAVDERAFLELLKRDVRCNIVFRECLQDLPAVWKDGDLRSVRSGREYTLHHYGGSVSVSQLALQKNRKKLLTHIYRGGEIIIRRNYDIETTFLFKTVWLGLVSVIRDILIPRKV